MVDTISDTMSAQSGEASQESKQDGSETCEKADGSAIAVGDNDDEDSASSEASNYSDADLLDELDNDVPVTSAKVDMDTGHDAQVKSENNAEEVQQTDPSGNKRADNVAGNQDNVSDNNAGVPGCGIKDSSDRESTKEAAASKETGVARGDAASSVTPGDEVVAAAAAAAAAADHAQGGELDVDIPFGDHHPRSSDGKDDDTLKGMGGREMSPGYLRAQAIDRQGDTEAAVSPTRVSADIGGRFHVDTSPSGDPEQSAATGTGDGGDGITADAGGGGGQTEPIYDDVAKCTMQRKKEEELALARLGGLLYENVGAVTSPGSGDDDDGWGSSEFESYDDASEVFDIDSKSDGSVRSLQDAQAEAQGQGHGKGKGKGKREGKGSSGAFPRRPKTGDETLPPAPARRSKRWMERAMRSSLSPEVQLTPGAVLDRLAARLAPRGSRKSAPEPEDPEFDSTMVDVKLDMEKHPPPELPPQPEGLTPLQVKRRHIVTSIVESEISYVSTLRRLVEDYEDVLLAANPPILKTATIRLIFYKVRDIVQCHNIFQIELAEYIRCWDQDETIGNVFTASFSKAVVFEAYSAFVNNFSISMDTARKQGRSKPVFAEFLQMKQSKSRDKLSLFGLMVKPVQRFPQFILMLQDLLKHTPQDHHDRLALQMALTEIENLTHKLNETKRESESQHDVKKLLHHLAGRHTIKAEGRYLVRQDDLIHMDTSGEGKHKSRRLFLLNDLLILTTVMYKETDTGIAERFKLKWALPLEETEVEENALSATYRVQLGHGRTTVTKHESPGYQDEVHPHQKEMDDMLHDLPIFEQITQLVEQLRLRYQGLTPELLYSATKTLHLLIQQKSDVNQCVISLLLPNSKSHSKSNCVFEMESPGAKQDWLLDLKKTKLARDPRNHPGWCLPERESGRFPCKLPLFIKPLPLSITRQDSRVQCAVPILLPSHDRCGVGHQHLWVCSGEGRGQGQVTVVSLHTSQPHAVESFSIGESVSVVCLEAVPGTPPSGDPGNGLLSLQYPEDTVWMATDDNRILVLRVRDDQRRCARQTIETGCLVMSLKYLDQRVYAGLQSGELLIFTRDPNGIWCQQRRTLSLGSTSVSFLLAVDSQLWAACGNNIAQVTWDTPTGGTAPEISMVSHAVSQPEDGAVECLVKAGVGMVLSFRNKAVLRLFHLEMLQHLQDINLSSAIRTFFEGRSVGAELHEGLKRVSITCMVASRGLLWVGTSVGCVLSLPLPRLEGVPQVNGRPTISYHAHTSQVKFLVAVDCGAVPLPIPGAPAGPALFQDSSREGSPAGVGGDVPASGRANGLDRDTSRDATAAAGPERRRDFTPDGNDVTGETPGSTPGAVTAAPQRNALSKVRWTSSPDLRLMGCPDDVRSLYGSLMDGIDDEYEVDMERGFKRKKRHLTAALSDIGGKVSHRVNKLSEAYIKGKQQAVTDEPPMPAASRYKTLPLMADSDRRPSGGGAGMSAAVAPSSDKTGNGGVGVGVGGEFSGKPPTAVCLDHASAASGSPSPQTQRHPHRASSSRRTPLLPGTAAPKASHVAKNKAVIMASGGEGHINWAGAECKALESKYEDICLLLWQCLS